MPSAVYPGSLDPVTFGHIDAIADTARAFGNVVVALGVNPGKTYMFSLAEREALTRQATAHIPGVSVTSFSGMLVHYLVRNGESIVVRGLRDETDYSDAVRQDTYGWQQTLAKDVTAFYVPARPGKEFVSSTSLKVVVKEQGNAVPLAPLSTLQATQARMLGQYVYGITGPSGAGKTTICRMFGEIAKRRGIPLVHIDLDRLGHEILSTADEPLYRKVRADVVAAFGPQVVNEDGSINRKQLGQMVFGEADKLEQLNAILHDPIFFRLNDMLRGKAGLFLVDAALLAESRRTPLVHNNVLLVEAPADVLAGRLDQRDDLNAEQVARRVASQFTADAKAAAVQAAIQDANHGTLARLVNAPGLPDQQVEEAFDTMMARVDIYGELRITAFLKALGVADAVGAYKSVRALYSGHDRFYHGLA
ncbi:MAG: pantetheine-phosphate adenylyltransferase, partial [Alphaproteobacteria bacterium]